MNTACNLQMANRSILLSWRKKNMKNENIKTHAPPHKKNPNKQTMQADSIDQGNILRESISQYGWRKYWFGSQMCDIIATF